MTEIKHLGRYKIKEHIGSGAFADVYRAMDTTLKRTVALKVLKPRLLADEEAFARFVQEAQTAAELFHPHIATVLDLGEAEGHYYIAMRYVDGPSLDKILFERKSLPWKVAVEILEQISGALQYAHNRGLIHRDVKPQNILLSGKEGAVITDFGLVKTINANGITDTGSSLGTPYYMAPEVWNNEAITAATDQYALACVVVELLTGKTLFPGNSPAEIMTKHFKLPAFPQRWPRGTHKRIEIPLNTALSPKKENRYPTINDFIQELIQSNENQNTEIVSKFKSSEKSNAQIKAKFNPPNQKYSVSDDSMTIFLERSEIKPSEIITLKRIPAGPFLMGSNVYDEYTNDDEQPQHEVYLDEYWIGQSPITVAQFTIFEKNTKYKTTNEIRESNSRYRVRTWKDAARGKHQHPVTYISWYDAKAFCRWLSEEIGLRVVLPTEAEWEKAARGPDGRVWPWGNEEPNEKRCNIDGHATTQINNFSPQADSPYKCTDMIGNVREWTESLYRDYPYKLAYALELPKIKYPRVLRGGANVTCTIRRHENPKMCDFHIGFRICASLENRTAISQLYEFFKNSFS